MTMKSFLSGAFVLVSALLCGFLTGGFLGTRVFGGVGMGWDRLADALGGMAVGLICATVLSVLLILYLDIRRRWIAGAVLLALSVLAWVLLRVVPIPPMV